MVKPFLLTLVVVLGAATVVAEVPQFRFPRLSTPGAPPAPPPLPPDPGNISSYPLMSDNNRTFAQIATFVGGFRTPASGLNGFITEDFPKTAIAYDPSNNTMYMTGRNKVDGVQIPGVAHLNVPPLVLASSTASMNYATFVSGGYVDPTEGRRSETDPGATSEYAAAFALAIQGNRLIGSLNIAYDSNNIQAKSIYSRPKNLSTLGDVLGMTRFWDGTKNDVTPWTGAYEHYLAGVLAPVPNEYQSALGGNVIGGSAHTSIVSVQSYGPSIIAFNTSDIGGTGIRPAEPLAFYPSSHQTLGTWEGNSDFYGHAWMYTGMAVIDGTRSILVSGRRMAAGAQACYGYGTTDQSLHMTAHPVSDLWCYDLTNSEKGNHGYPYEYFLLEYDINHLMEVKAGTRLPWNVTPTKIWNYTFPIAHPGAAGLGGSLVVYETAGLSYDPATRRLWIAQRGVNLSGCCVYGAVIWAMELDITPFS